MSIPWGRSSGGAAEAEGVEAEGEREGRREGEREGRREREREGRREREREGVYTECCQIL